MSIEIQRPPIRKVRPALRVAARPSLSRNLLVRSGGLVVTRPALRIAPTSPLAENLDFLPYPYVDYGRRLTPQGGVAMMYKDIDTRFRYTLRRLFLWSLATGAEGWYLRYHSPIHNLWIGLGCLLALAIINWLIVQRPVEVYRDVEVRPDCLIIEGDVFWLRHMENGWPSFRRDDEGNQILCGIYGTRFVEYLTARRFDDFDRAAEVFAAHLQQAMRQLWTGLP